MIYLTNIKYHNKLPIKDKFLIGMKRGVEQLLKLNLPLLILKIATVECFFKFMRIRTYRFFLSTCIIHPVLEELAFRGLLQEGIKKITLIAIIRFGGDEKKGAATAYQVSRVATSILFGAAHIATGSVFQGVVSGLGAFLGEAELKEKIGLPAAIGCHMSNNAICWATLFLVR